uniref:MADF domain-containing protein n=1 Tax=Acrobeloides nanus TaxID=290746 RepID=A0A914BXL8_9BILA
KFRMEQLPMEQEWKNGAIMEQLPPSNSLNYSHLSTASTSNAEPNKGPGHSTKKVWYKNIPRESVLRMIELIKDRNVLYDITHPNYSANHYRNVMYKKITEQLVAEGHFDYQNQIIEVQDVWLSLRRKFVRENARPPTPDGTIKESDFEYYEALKFLKDFPAKEKSETAPKRAQTSRKRAAKLIEQYSSPHESYNGGEDIDFYANFRYSLEPQAGGSANWIDNLSENKLPKWEDLDGVDEETPSMEAASESSNAYLNSLVQRATAEEQKASSRTQVISIESTNSSESQANAVPFDETTRALGQNVMEMYSSLKNEGSLRQAADFRKKIHDLIYEYDVYLAEK